MAHDDAHHHIEETAVRLKQQKRKKLRRLIGALILVLIVAVYLAYRHFQMFESTDDAFIDGRYSMISPRVPGYVTTIHVTDNQWVNAGDLLVEIDPADYKARLDAAQAELAAAKAAEDSRNLDVSVMTVTTEASLTEAQANLDTARAALKSAKAQARSAEAQHLRDSTDLKRIREMLATQVVSQQSLDHMIAAEQMSSANLTAALQTIDTRKSQIRQAEARLASARTGPEKVSQSRSQALMAAADVRKAEAQVEQARLNLSYTRIMAPVDGFVTRKNVSLGVLVQAGQSLLSIVPKEVWVTANFKETQIEGMLVGLPVSIKVDSYPDLELTGHVDSLQRGTGSVFSLLPSENATGNFVKVVQRIPVKIVIDSQGLPKDVILTPGMSVTARVSVINGHLPAADGKNARDEAKKGGA
jgi:membrane fusion protein, multidrug efflux system